MLVWPATSEAQAEELIQYALAHGWKIEQVGSNFDTLVRSYWGSFSGHLLTAVLTGWWTLFLGNLLYAWIAHRTERVMVTLNG